MEAKTGTPPPPLRDAPELDEYTVGIWNAYHTLAPSRRHIGERGNEPSYIPMSEIDPYLSRFGRATCVDDDEFVSIIRAMDEVIIDHWRKTARAAATKKPKHK